MSSGAILQKVSFLGAPNGDLTNHGRCHPTYLSPKAHVKLSSPGAFDGLRIHTDEINEVIKRITPGSLTIAVVSVAPSATVRSTGLTCVLGHGLDGLVRP